MPDVAAIQAAFDVSRRTRFVYVTTNGPDGYPNTRVMFNLRRVRARVLQKGPAALANGFATWLGTNTSSTKTGEARRDPRVCLYYANLATFEGLTLTGALEEVLDREVKAALWMKTWDMYYPGGLDGDDFTVFRFVPVLGRYYHGLRVVSFDASQPLESLVREEATVS